MRVSKQTDIGDICVGKDYVSANILQQIWRQSGKCMETTFFIETEKLQGLLYVSKFIQCHQASL